MLQTVWPEFWYFAKKQNGRHLNFFSPVFTESLSPPRRLKLLIWNYFCRLLLTCDTNWSTRILIFCQKLKWPPFDFFFQFSPKWSHFVPFQLVTFHTYCLQLLYVYVYQPLGGGPPWITRRDPSWAPKNLILFNILDQLTSMEVKGIYCQSKNDLSFI